MKQSTALLCASVLALSAVGSGQTVTVSQDSTADYTSISGALASFNPDPDTNADNVIQVIDYGVYDEVVNINTPVTLEATGTSKATIAVQGNALGRNANGGIVINLPAELTTGTVVLRNLNIIPSLNTQGAWLSTGIEQQNNNVFLLLDNLVIAPNDGNNVPLVSDATTNRVLDLILGQPTFDPNIVQFGDDAIIGGSQDANYPEGDGVEWVVRDCVISHIRGDLIKPTAPTNSPDCIVFGGGWSGSGPYPDIFRKITIEGTGGFSYGRIGLCLMGEAVVQGDPVERMNIRGHSLAGIYFDQPTGQTTTRDISNVIIDGVSQYGIWDNGRGDIRYSLRDSIVYFMGRGVLFTKKQSTAVGGDNIFENCTLVDGRTGNYHSYRWESGNTINIEMRNCILGGKFNWVNNDAKDQALNVVWFSVGTGITADISSSAAMTTGPFALRPGAPFASQPQEMESVIYDDAKLMIGGSRIVPDGVSYDDPSVTPGTYDVSQAGFLDVSNAVYAEAADLDPGDGVTSAPLAGGADYVGPPASVLDWGLYSVGSAQYEHELHGIIKLHNQHTNAKIE